MENSKSSEGFKNDPRKEVVNYFNLLMGVTGVLLLLLLNFAFNVYAVKEIPTKISLLESKNSQLSDQSSHDIDKFKIILKMLDTRSDEDLINAAMKLLQWLDNAIDESIRLIEAESEKLKQIEGRYGMLIAPRPSLPSDILPFLAQLNLDQKKLVEEMMARPAEAASVQNALKILHRLLDLRFLVKEKLYAGPLLDLFRRLIEKMKTNQMDARADLTTVIQDLMKAAMNPSVIFETKIESNQELIRHYQTQAAEFKDKLNGRIKIFDIETPVVLVIPLIPMILASLCVFLFVHYRLLPRKSRWDLSPSDHFLFNSDRASALLACSMFWAPALFCLLYYPIIVSLSEESGGGDSILFAYPFDSKNWYHMVILVLNVISITSSTFISGFLTWLRMRRL